jgi:signal transduction histidine kinase
LTDRLTATQSKVDELRQREETAREARNALEIKLVSSRAEADTLSDRLTVLETDLSQAHANAEAQVQWHKAELGRFQEQWQEAALSAERLDAVMEGMMAGLIITDPEGAILQSNVASEILLDRGRDEMIGLHLTAISDDERWQQAIATAQGSEAVRLTIRVGTNTLMCDVAPLPDPDALKGEVRGLIAIFQDISSETDDQRTRLESISAMVEELRTPMTTIVSYTDLLLSESVGILGDLQRKFLLRIKAGAERIIQMIGDLTRESGGEERWTSPKRQAVDVGKLVESAVAGSHVQLEDKALTLDLDLPDGLPTIQADPDYLRRALANLISNACMASAVGGRIRVRAAQSDELRFNRETVRRVSDRLDQGFGGRALGGWFAAGL